MTSQPPRGPVIWTGLYVVALILSWLTLFSLERFGQYEVRAWAPLIQAVLSAAAIFAAWGLQNLKRRADRREQVHDTQTALLQYAYVFEWTLGRATLAVRGGGIPGEGLRLYQPMLKWAADAMDGLKISHLPSEKAIKEFVAFQHSSQLAMSVIDWAIVRNQAKLEVDYLDVSWRSVFRNRTDLMNALGVTPDDVRSDPPVRRSE